MRLLLAFAVAFAMMAPAGADHCEGPDTYPSDATVGPFYVVVLETCGPSGDGCPPWNYVYQESNGLPGLQRDDETVNNTCHGMAPGDTMLSPE